MPNPPSWQPLSACLWSTAAGIPSKTSIETIYPTLAAFFVTVLNVPTVTLPMVYDALLSAATANPTTRQLKRLWATFSDLLLLTPTHPPPPPEPLVTLPVFPVIGPDGAKELVSRETEFFIPDRQDLVAGFGGRVRCLDISPEVAGRMQHFFEWAGVGGRAMSKCVRQGSRVEGELWIVRNVDREVGRKAYAF